MNIGVRSDPADSDAVRSTRVPKVKDKANTPLHFETGQAVLRELRLFDARQAPADHGCALDRDAGLKSFCQRPPT